MNTHLSHISLWVHDQDEALAFYTEKLGYELRGDTRFGENGEYRWVEVAPPGSTARLALNPPMGGQPGGGGVTLDDLVQALAREPRAAVIDEQPRLHAVADQPRPAAGEIQRHGTRGGRSDRAPGRRCG